MANDDNFQWPPTALVDQFQEASENAAKQQFELKNNSSDK